MRSYVSSLIIDITVTFEHVSNLLEEASHLLQSQGRLETSQADCHLVVGGHMQTMQVAREPRQMSFNQPRPLGYVALPVSSSTYSRMYFLL